MSLRVLVLTCVIALSSGCNTIGNLLISPHPDSLAKPEAKLALRGVACDDEEFSAAAASDLVGVAVSLLQDVLEHEAKRYSASYSAGTAADLVLPGCLDFDAGDVGSFQVNLTADKPAFLLADGELRIDGVKSKVAAWPLRTIWGALESDVKAALLKPWSQGSWDARLGNLIGIVNPLMIVHWLYAETIDPGLYKVDVDVRVRLDTVIVSLNQSQLANLGQVDIGAGKANIFDLPYEKPDLKSGYLPLPYKPAIGLGEPQSRPTNVVVTIIEDNDFGDLVGKAAGQVGEHQSTIVDQLVNWLGL